MKTTLYIYIQNLTSFLEGQYGFSLVIRADEPDVYLTYSQDVFLTEIELDLTVDANEIREIAIDRIGNEINKNMADMEVKNMLLTDKLHSLLAIEHKEVIE